MDNTSDMHTHWLWTSIQTIPDFPTFRWEAFLNFAHAKTDETLLNSYYYSLPYLYRAKIIYNYHHSNAHALNVSNNAQSWKNRRSLLIRVQSIKQPSDIFSNLNSMVWKHRHTRDRLSIFIDYDQHFSIILCRYSKADLVQKNKTNNPRMYDSRCQFPIKMTEH